MLDPLVSTIEPLGTGALMRGQQTLYKQPLSSCTRIRNPCNSTLPDNQAPAAPRCKVFTSYERGLNS